MINIYCSGFKFSAVARDSLLNNGKVAEIGNPLLSGAKNG
jgi:hypothetical protein